MSRQASRVQAGPPTADGRRATVRDVAQHAGVALSTASRVLTGHPHASDVMRRRVLAAAEELGYQADVVAQSLRTGTTRTLGFLVADLANPIFADIVRGACDRAREQEYAVMLTNSEGDQALDREYLSVFLRRRVDGIMLVTVRSGEIEIDRHLVAPPVPIVVFDRDVPRRSRVSTVYVDYRPAFRDATASLLERGHTRIAFIGGPPDLRPVRERLAGFEAAHADRGLPVDPALVRLDSFDVEFGRRAAEDLLATAKPTAVVVSANRLLVGVLTAVHAAGLQVGRDLALISSDDVDLSRLYRPPISVVYRDAYEIGRTAAELLLERVIDEDAPIRSVTLPSRFIERESSALPAPPPSPSRRRNRQQPRIKGRTLS